MIANEAFGGVFCLVWALFLCWPAAYHHLMTCRLQLLKLRLSLRTSQGDPYPRPLLRCCCCCPRCRCYQHSLPAEEACCLLLLAFWQLAFFAELGPFVSGVVMEGVQGQLADGVAAKELCLMPAVVGGSQVVAQGVQ